MHDAREHRARNAEHRRDHQHQALRGGEGGGQRSGLQRAVHGAAGTGFALQFYQLHRLTKEVLSSMGGPVIHVVRHRARRRDRVDRGNFGKRIRDVRGGFVAVHGLHDFFRAHSSLLIVRLLFGLCHSLYYMQLCFYFQLKKPENMATEESAGRSCMSRPIQQSPWMLSRTDGIRGSSGSSGSPGHAAGHVSPASSSRRRS